MPFVRHRIEQRTDEALQRVQQVRAPLRPPLQVAEPLHRRPQLRSLPHVRLDGGRGRGPRGRPRCRRARVAPHRIHHVGGPAQ